MDSTSIELPGSEISSISLHESLLRVHFSRAFLIKTMTGSAERTRWWQAGDLLIAGAEVEGDIPNGPLLLSGGDVGENVYTYRDMIPLPLDTRGRVFCDLGFEGEKTRLRASGDSLRLSMIDLPKYIEHLRP